MDNTQSPRPVAPARTIATAAAMCPQCGKRALVKGRYDGPDGDSIPWAYCNRCPYNYEG